MSKHETITVNSPCENSLQAQTFQIGSEDPTALAENGNTGTSGLRESIDAKERLEKLHRLNSQSDLDLLRELKQWCKEEDREEVDLLIYLNDTVGIGWGEPRAAEYAEEFSAREEEYYDRKRVLLCKYDSEESWKED